MTNILSNHLGASALFLAPPEAAPASPMYANAFDDDEEDELGDLDPDEEEEDLFGDEVIEGIDEEDLDLDEEIDLDGEEEAWDDEDEEAPLADDEEEDDL